MIKLIYNDLGKKKILCRSNHTTKNDLCNRRKMTYVTVSSHPPVSDFVYYLKMRHLAKKKKRMAPLIFLLPHPQREIL